MTAARVIALHFAPSAPPPCAEGTLLSASTVSVAIADIQGRDAISSRVSMGVPATSSSAAAVQIIRQRRGALSYLPAATSGRPMTYLEFSRQVLRGLALEASNDRAGAREAWLLLM
jgi:hypothetical protein